MIKIIKQNNGFALLLTLLVSSIVLSIGLVLLSLTMKQIDLATVSRESEVSFQAARSGMECLQYLRHNHDELILDGTDDTYECYGQSFQLSDANGAAWRQEYSAEFDLLPPNSTQPQCLKIEMIIVNDNAQNRTITFTDRNINRVCNQGDTCTVGFAQGYNRSCSESGSGGLYIVQRELTAEF